ncbi:unnamed protein product [Nesidiocoris tenuis]|uniref:Uncharacterized protein n=1 Tax=Nesidiocoris tenuis TaxID=355587 RepID=A0A6H5FUY9_9HEMI|nr:unnamed protein product [Nesidiocoris tenuis]
MLLTPDELPGCRDTNPWPDNARQSLLVLTVGDHWAIHNLAILVALADKINGTFTPPYWCKHRLLTESYVYPDLKVEADHPVLISDVTNKANVYYQQVVCLYIGWGLPGTPGIDYVEYVEPAPEAFHLQHTWRSIMSYIGCADLMIHMDGFNKALRERNFVFSDYYSFGCNEWFGRYRGSPSPGDAGSPVTCIDDIFFGLIGWIFETNENSTAKKQLAGDSLIVHTLYENSADYRKSFLAMVDHLTFKRDYPEFSEYLPVPYEKTLKEESFGEIISLPPPSAGGKWEIRVELLALLVLRIFILRITNGKREVQERRETVEGEEGDRARHSKQYVPECTMIGAYGRLWC